MNFGEGEAFEIWHVTEIGLDKSPRAFGYYTVEREEKLSTECTVRQLCGSFTHYRLLASTLSYRNRPLNRRISIPILRTPPSPFLAKRHQQPVESGTLLNIDLNPPLITRRTTPQLRKQVGDIIPRMPIQPRPQPLLVQEMRNQPNTPAQHEEAVEHAHLQVLLGLLGGEGAAVAQQVDEADGDAAVDVEDQVVLFGGRDGLDGDGVVEELGAGEVVLAEFFDEGDAQVGVVAGFDAVADAGDCGLLARASVKS